MKNAKTILIAVLALLVLIVILQNTKAVETRILFFTITMPRVLLLILMLVVGFSLGVAYTIRQQKRKKQG